MKRLFAIIFLLGLLCETARAGEVGYDFLGIKSKYWNCQDMLDAINTRPGRFPCGAFVDNTFGTSDLCLRRLLASNKCSSFRGHLAWTNHKPASAAQLIPTAKYLDALAVQYPQISFFASAICEHHLSASQSSALNAALKPYLPHAQMVDSGLVAADSQVIRECHGSKARCPIVSLDGHNAVDIDIEDFKSHGSQWSLIWNRGFNCRLENGFTPPPQRKDCAKRDEFMWAVRISYPQPAWPAGQRLNNGQIYKNFAEYYGGADTRGNKPMFILRAKQPQVDIFAMNGRKIATAKYYGSFATPGLYRYYINDGLTSFQLGQKAETVAGSEFVYFPTNRGSYLINAYRRGPTFR